MSETTATCHLISNYSFSRIYLIGRNNSKTYSVRKHEAIELCQHHDRKLKLQNEHVFCLFQADFLYSIKKSSAARLSFEAAELRN